MRKFFTTLKSVVAVALISAMTLSVSCSYDDTALTDRIANVETGLADLQKRVADLEAKLQTEVAALQSLIDGKTVIVGVETDTEGNQIIKLSNGETITVLAPTECKYVPCDHECTPCECDPLEYRVVDGVLEVSADGVNWVAINGVAPECVVADVIINEDGTATVKLADGQEFTTAVAELIEIAATRGQAYVKAGETKGIAFSINDAVVDINVMNQPLGWKATVEEVVEEAEPQAGVLAVGGKNYLLNVTGPKFDLVEAGIADKEGVVSVHFNTAAGACKVLKLDVNLAEISVEMDRTGHMFISNSLVDSYVQVDWYGEEFIQEFNNYYVAVINLDDYTEDLESIYNANWGEFEVPCAGGWVSNFFMNVNERNSYEEFTYVEGENEEFVFDVTVEELIDYLDWYGQLSYEGNSFMVLVVPTDVSNGGALLLDQAIAVPFKQLNVDVQVVKEESFNVYFDATLRGGVCYNLYPYALKELDYYIENGYYASYEEFFASALEQYIAQPQYSQFGLKVEADVKESNIALLDLLGYTLDYDPYIDIAPDTDYIMAIFAEEEGRTDYTIDDIKFVYYSTAALTPAEEAAEYTVAYNEEDHGYTRIALDVTVPAGTARAYYKFYDEEQLEEDVLVAELIDMGYEKTPDDFDENNAFYATQETALAGQEKHFYALIVNAEGEYTLAYEVVKSKEVVLNDAVVAIESVEFAPTSATIKLSGLEGLEVSDIKYYIVTATANSYYFLSQEELQDIAYGNNWMYKSTTANPIVATQTADYKYEFTYGTTYNIAVGVQFADGTVSAPMWGEYEYPLPDNVFAPVRAELDLYLDGYAVNGNDSEYGYWLYDAEGNCLEVVVHYCVNSGWSYSYAAKLYKVDGTVVEGYQSLKSQRPSDYNCAAGEKYYVCVATLNDGTPVITETQIATTEVDYIGADGVNNYVYTGAGNVEPEPEPIEPSASAVLVTDTTFNGFNPYDVTFTFATGDKVEIRFNTSGNQYLHLGAWQTDAWQDPHYISQVKYNGELATATACNVAYENDAYTVTMSVFEYTNYATLEYTYTGAIEGLNAPEACDCLEPKEPENPEGGDVINVTIQDLSVGYDQPGEKELQFWYSATNAHVIDFKGFNSCNPGQPLAAGTYSSEDYTIDANYCIFDYGTTNGGMSDIVVVVTDNGDGTYTYDAKFSHSGQKYAFVYTGAFPQ